jgi:heat shock protein 90kDa beta
MNNLHSLFDAHAPSLATPFSALPLQSLLSSLPVSKLGLDIGSLAHEFEKYQRERTARARADFDEMLKENAFMEFWGRLGKIGGEGVDGGVQAEDLGEDEGEGGGGKVDMKALAKSVDVGDMEKVLKVSLQYINLELCSRIVE